MKLKMGERKADVELSLKSCATCPHFRDMVVSKMPCLALVAIGILTPRFD